MPLPARKPSTKAAPAGRRRARREGPSEAGLDGRRRPVAGVVQEPGGPTLHQAVGAAALGEDLEHGRQLASPGRVIDDRQGRLGRAQPIDHLAGRVVVERLGGAGQAGDDAHHQLVEHDPQVGDVGAAHVAVALGVGERAEGVHQLADVGVACGEQAEDPHRRPQRVREIGEQGEVDGCRGVDEAARLGDLLDEPRRRRRLDRRPVAGQLDDAHRQLGLPHEPPRLAERPARAAPFLERAPRDAERGEAVEEVRAAQAVGRPQVELDGARRRLRLQPSAPLGRGEVAGQRDLRRTRRHLADGIADDELVDDEREPAEHRLGGVEDLREPGAGPAPQDGQRVGESGRRDQVIGRGRHAPPPQRVSGIDEEPRDPLRARMGEHVGVPAGADDAGAVPGGPPEAAMGPRHPRHGDLHLRLAAQQRRVGLVGGQRRIERRDVPRPAHDGHRGAGGQRGAHPPTHVGLAPGIERRRRGALAHRGHRLADRVEHRLAVAAVLDEVLPPPLGVRLAGRGGEVAERIDGWAATAPHHRHPVVAGRQREGEREVDRLDDHVVLEGPAHRLPLRAEAGERREDRPLGLGDDVAEERHRRHQLGVGDPAQGVVGVGRRLDEHDVGRQGIEGPHDRTGRAGAVVADAEQVQSGCRTRRCRRRRLSPVRDRRRRSRPSRRGHGPPPRGTRATRRRRGGDRGRPHR